MKYEARGQFVFDPESIVSVAAAENRVEAERFAAELNRLAEERGALLEACRRVRDGLDAGEHPGQFASILDGAIAKAEGGEA